MLILSREPAEAVSSASPGTFPFVFNLQGRKKTLDMHCPCGEACILHAPALSPAPDSHVLSANIPAVACTALSQLG